jgi:hypothetical protein
MGDNHNLSVITLYYLLFKLHCFIWLWSLHIKKLSTKQTKYTNLYMPGTSCIHPDSRLLSPHLLHAVPLILVMENVYIGTTHTVHCTGTYNLLSVLSMISRCVLSLPSVQLHKHIVLPLIILVFSNPGQMMMHVGLLQLYVSQYSLTSTSPATHGHQQTKG